MSSILIWFDSIDDADHWELICFEHGIYTKRVSKCAVKWEF